MAPKVCRRAGVSHGPGTAEHGETERFNTITSDAAEDLEPPLFCSGGNESSVRVIRLNDAILMRYPGLSPAQRRDCSMSCGGAGEG